MSEHDATGTTESTDTDDAPGVDGEREREEETKGEFETGSEESNTTTEAESADITGNAEDIDDLTERVEAASDEQIAREIASLRSLVSDLEERGSDADAESDIDPASDPESERVADLESKLARKQADFENFKKRMNKRRAEERERATEDLVTRLLSVRDDLLRALSQDSDTEIRGGVESTLEEFDRVLDDEGVSEISPEPGTETDPGRHEVMMRVDSEHLEGAIAEVFRSGYEMGGKVLRPAQVTVSEGDTSDTGDE